MIEWKTETRNLKDLVPNAKNPRRMNKDMADGLKKSLEKFGLCEPIVINWNGEIIGGHQRVKTLQAMGRKQAQVMVPVTELSDEDKDELCIRLNKNQGYFDDDLLANAWEIDLLMECGFTPQELHIAEIEDEVKDNQGATITISLNDLEHATMLEMHLNTILCDYPGSKMRLKK
jgi:ParB-like chromosome segregation protein Spo0J